MAFQPEKTLRVRRSKRENDWMIDYPRKSDGWLMHSFVRGDITFPELVRELQQRGYDTDSLRLSVNRIPAN